MPLVYRSVKGSPLTIAEADGNISFLNTAIGNKVDKVTGKALSTNDYSDEDKTKLQGIRTLIAGTNITFDDTVEGQRTITSTGGGGGEGTVQTVNDVLPDEAGNVQITKNDIGLNNVNNTADTAKPVSTAQQTALDLKVDKVEGKELSDENYTTEEKTKLAGLSGSTLTKFAFFLSDGTPSYIPLTGDNKLPFFLTDGSPSNIPMSA